MLNRARQGYKAPRNSVGRWCTNLMPSLLPSKTSTLQTRDKRGIQVLSSLGSCYPHTYEPDFLQLAMDQCRLRLKEQGELVPTNTEPHEILCPPPWDSRPWGPYHHVWIWGGWGAPLHLSCLALRGNGGNWKSNSIGCHHFQPLLLTGNGLLFPQSP